MKKGRLQLWIIAGLIIVVLLWANEHFRIHNFKVVEPGVLYTSGQPRGMDYARLFHKYHIATIVNLRSEAEHRERNWYNEERTWLSGNRGVDYHEIPLAKADGEGRVYPTEQQQQEFLAIMDDKRKHPVLLHGSVGKKRVAMMTAIWLVKSKGVDFEEAIEEAEQILERDIREGELEFLEELAGD